MTRRQLLGLAAILATVLIVSAVAHMRGEKGGLGHPVPREWDIRTKGER